MNKTAVWIAVVVVIILGVGGWFYSRNASAPQPLATDQTVTPPAPSPSAPVPVPAPAPSPTPAASNVKEFTVTAANYSFAPAKITVKKGDTVKITVVNSEGFHDLKIDEFNAATPRLAAGKSAVIQFVADKAGSFQYYCSVGNHRAMGMWGTLVVE